MWNAETQRSYNYCIFCWPCHDCHERKLSRCLFSKPVAILLHKQRSPSNMLHCERARPKQKIDNRVCTAIWPHSSIIKRGQQWCENPRRVLIQLAPISPATTVADSTTYKARRAFVRSMNSILRVTNDELDLFVTSAAHVSDRYQATHTVSLVRSYFASKCRGENCNT